MDFNKFINEYGKKELFKTVKKHSNFHSHKVNVKEWEKMIGEMKFNQQNMEFEVLLQLLKIKEEFNIE